MNEGTKRIDFVISGTQKGGTTALHTMLASHPDVGTGSTKEIHFFDDDGRFTGGDLTYDHYHSFFSWNGVALLRGETTPIYMYWEPAPRRMMEYNPGLRLIVMLRNPIDRAFSHWNMERNRDAEPLEFADALRAEPERLMREQSGQHRVFSYVDRGRYARQLQRLWACFPREQVLALKSESFRDNPGSVFDQVCRFLGLRQIQARPPANPNAGIYASRIGQREDRMLGDMFADEVRQVEDLLGWDCRDWRMSGR